MARKNQTKEQAQETPAALKRKELLEYAQSYNAMTPMELDGIIRRTVDRHAHQFLTLARSIYGITTKVAEKSAKDNKVTYIHKYRALGFKTLADYLGSVNFGGSQAKGYQRLGRALQHLAVSDDTLVKVGYSACLQLSRLAQTEEKAEGNVSLIERLIGSLVNDGMTHAELKATIDKALGVEKPENEETGADGNENETGAKESKMPAWKVELLRFIGTAQSMEAVSEYVATHSDIGATEDAEDLAMVAGAE